MSGPTATGSIDLAEHLGSLADRDASRSEADLQSAVQTLLLYGGLNLEDPQVRLETPAPNRRRVDIETGRTVIECKKDLRVGNIRTEAIDQLRGYVEDRTAELGQRYAGVLTDGAQWELFHLEQASGTLESVSTFLLRSEAPDVDGLLTWLEGVLSTAELLKPTPTEVERKLGARSPGFSLDLAELRDVYAQCRKESEVALKRELWARLLAAAFGTNFEDNDDLFIEHTYLVLTAEVIAHALMGFDLRGGEIDPTELATGELFRKRDIGGVVDADFFDWPIETEQGKAFITGLGHRLARFDWASVDHDVLKVLYESVIDAETRHSLGEYYTPDWLAERIVTEVVDDPLNQRVLDPACGSGTFLFWAVRRYLAAADEAGQSNADAVAGAAAHVFGIDLHPVAVTLARVTFLLAIGTDRLQERSDLNIPVYLGDSIQVAQNTGVMSAEGISIYTSDGLELFAQELKFPESVVADAATFDRLVAEMAEQARTSDPATKRIPAFAPILDRYAITEKGDREQLTTTFKALCALHDNHRNHIWAYYVRNLARPLEFSRPTHRVDRLLGNPPWLRYNAMPAATQDNFRRLSMARQIWAAPQVVTSLDLSGLFVARSCELYLKEGGRFGFVMPAAVLSRLQYEGFRQANFASDDANVTVAFEGPWELSRVRPQPFPVPAGVVFGTRTEPPAVAAMPAEASWWEGALDHHHHIWSEVSGLLEESVAPVIVSDGNYAAPYGPLVRQGANLVPRLFLTVVDQPPDPLGVPVGKRAVQSRRTRDEREPWKNLPTIKGTVEEQFCFPIVLGESLVPFRVKTTVTSVIPHDGQTLLAGTDAIAKYPGLADWWSTVSRGYDRNKPDSTEHDLAGQIDYQSKLRSQFPLRPNRVIYTGRGAKVAAARVGDDRTVVDHALYWLPVGSPEEGRYLCAILNSRALGDRVEAGFAQGLFGGRNIHRAPFRLFFPEFDADDRLHRAIASVGAQAEEVAQSVDLAAVDHTPTARKRVRETLIEAGIQAELETLVERLLSQPPPSPTST